MVRCSKYHTCPSWAVVGGQNPDQAREHWNQLHRQQDQEADGPIIDHLQPGDKVQLRINAGDRWRDGLIKENEQLGLVATYRRSAGYFLLDDLQEHQIRLVEN